MPSASTIGALRFVLGADTATFEKNLKGAEASLKRVAAVGATVGTVIGNVLVGAFGSLGRSIKSAIDQADKMDETAQKVGLTTEKLSALKFAAEQSGVSFETFTRSAVILSRNMAAAAADSSSQAGRAFAAVGVAVTNAAGQLRPMQEVLLSPITLIDGLASTAIDGRTG